MNKILITLKLENTYLVFNKLLRGFKLTLALMLCLATFMQVSASTFAQKISLNVKNASFEDVLHDISKQTGYNFLYNEVVIKSSKVITLSVTNQPLEKVLQLCIQDQPLTFIINENTVIIKKKETEKSATLEKQVSGTVSDNSGETMPGVSVRVKGTGIGVITTIDGKYTITVPDENSILVFSFIGYATQEINVKNKSQINIVLKETMATLNDVVVIGYGNQKRQDVNGAVSSVKASDLQDIPQVSIDQLLQGKAAGVTITQNSGGPGSATSVHIRGITSLSLSNEPLYVIDGVAISGDASNGSSSGRSQALSPNNGETGVSPLSSLNPNDIESIDILKDASAAAIYGARASNGVIIVTTKRGKNGAGRVNYDGYYGFQQQGKLLKMMDLPQYARLQNALADIQGTNRRGEFVNPELLGKGTNWQQEIFKTAPQQSHQLSFSGAKNESDYYIAAGYLNQDGSVIGNDFNRYNVRGNFNSQVRSWLKVGTVLGGARTFSNTSLSNNTGIIYTSLLSAPDQVVYNADGTFAGPQADQVGGQINPVAQALNVLNTFGRNNFNGNLYADVKFLKDFTLRSEVNGDFNFTNAKLFTPSYNYGPRFINPTANLSIYNTNSTFWTWKEYVTYAHTFKGKHSLNGLVAHELTRSVYNDNSAGVANFLSNDLPALGLGDSKTATVGEYIGAPDVLESVFARGIYTYNNKYSLTATIRSDRSSKFAQGNQTGYFPSFAASWRISDEPFMKSIKKVVDNVKFRVGYGEVGNQNVPGYLYGSALTAVQTGIGTGFTVDKVANPNLKWETAIQTDFGVDFSLFNGRIDASADYFYKTSKDFLFQSALPAFLLGQNAEYSGVGVISPPYINGGKLTNNGYDFSIASKNVVSKNFKWSTSVVFAHYKNKVVSLATGIPYISQNVTTSFLALPVTRTQAGSSVGEYYGYKAIGVFKTDEQLRNSPVQFGRPKENTNIGTWLGDVQFEDVDGNGKIDQNDQTFIGNPNPKFTYGITNNFSYKAFDLSVFLNGSYGAKIFNVLNYQIGSLGSLYQNQLASKADFWTPQNPTSDIPRPRGGDNPNLFNSNRFIESGSFLRIQNVQLGYNLPASLLKTIKISSLKVYASGQNLYVFTPYKGLDPEVGAVNQNVYLQNVDLGRYPSPRTITFGINANF